MDASRRVWRRLATLRRRQSPADRGCGDGAQPTGTLLDGATNAMFAAATESVYGLACGIGTLPKVMLTR